MEIQVFARRSLHLVSVVSICLSANLSFGAGPACNLSSLHALESQLRSIELDNIKSQARRIPKEFDTEVDSRRLVNLDDWGKLNPNPHLVYTEQTFDAWRRADSFISEKLDRPLTPGFLKEIHKISTEGMPFHGFEGRRLLLRLKSGEIDRETFNKLISETYSKNHRPSGVDHSIFSGKFRDDPIDEILHAGSDKVEGRGRVFSKAELEAVRKNPHMKVDESSVVDLGNGTFEAKTYYASPNKIEASVDLVFKNLNEELRDAKTDRDIIKAVARMQKDLVSIHPFLDGNGRTIRLLGDHIFKRYGLPPPILVSEKELEQSIDEIADQIQIGMRLYVEEKAKGAGR